MKFTNAQIEIIRVSLLRYIAQGEGAISTGYLLAFVRAEGFRSFDLTMCRAELQYLADKALIEEVNKLLSPENKHWRITASGRDFLAAQES